MGSMRGLLRQGMAYGLAGGMALLLDWASFVALTWLGMPSIPANVLARLAGALLAYLLNGVFTFRDAEGSKLGWRRFGRYVATWCVMTLASTWAIQAIEQGAGLQWAWLAKPAVEGVLAAITFVVYRAWIYK
ncbi:GtrA family protein [Thermomonas sp.]|uniref:GtrA family protein n=1 Tax=Thermomonas sp. TaxID=1971895 RepID=UPI0026101F22|nr:GtrA family protein [Thermomonas sp.]